MRTVPSQVTRVPCRKCGLSPCCCGTRRGPQGFQGSQGDTGGGDISEAAYGYFYTTFDGSIASGSDIPFENTGPAFQRDVCRGASDSPAGRRLQHRHLCAAGQPKQGDGGHRQRSSRHKHAVLDIRRTDKRRRYARPQRWRRLDGSQSHNAWYSGSRRRRSSQRRDRQHSPEPHCRPLRPNQSP
jgi:hypothetical protein